jgi:hypothetical protein
LKNKIKNVGSVHGFVRMPVPPPSRWNIAWNRGVSGNLDRWFAKPMTTAAEYRQYADECLTAMRAAVIPEVRAALFIAAQRWNTLADRTAEEEALPAVAHASHTRSAGTGAQTRN